MFSANYNQQNNTQDDRMISGCDSLTGLELYYLWCVVRPPKVWACYKAQLKEDIYNEWARRWTNDNAYRMTKIFYPKPDSNKAKKILKLNRGQLKKLIELITGQNNLNYMNNKVYGSEDLCRFCEEEEETFDHIINECPCFYLDRCDLLQNQPIINTCLLYTSPSPRD